MEEIKKKKIAFVIGVFMLLFAVLQIVSEIMYDVTGAIFSAIGGVGLLYLASLSPREKTEVKPQPQEVEQKNKFLMRWIYVGVILGALAGGHTLLKMNISILSSMVIISVAVIVVVLGFKAILYFIAKRIS